MRFRLLEAPSALGSASRTKPQTIQSTDPPKSALGSDSRTKPAQTTATKSAFGAESRTQTKEEPKLYDTKDGSKTGVKNNPAGEDYNKIFRDSKTPRENREIALVKWLEQNMAGRPLTTFLSSRIKIDSLDDIPTMIGGSFEERTQQAEAESKFRKVVEETAKKRSELADVFNAIFTSIDNDTTLFDNVLLKLKLQTIQSNHYENLAVLSNIVVEDNTFDTNKKYLLNPSLYNRPVSDFSYTAKVMDKVHNEAKCRKYYNPANINIKDLYDGNEIKPAGILAKDPDDFNTIYGVLESWKETAPNENTDKKHTNSEKSEYEYSSFEEADKNKQNQDGSIITINGKFKFNGKNQKWEPLKK